MKKITYEQVKTLALCINEPELFKQLFGEEAKLTKRNFNKAKQAGLNIRFLCFMIASCAKYPVPLTTLIIRRKNCLPETMMTETELDRWRHSFDTTSSAENANNFDAMYDFLKSF
jgi:hypothetical protein